MTVAPARHDDYVAFCEGVRALCDIDLLQYKRGQMERRIRSFAARRGIRGGLLDYLTLLRRGEADELAAFLDRVTINVSQLWRNPEQWAMLARNVVPDLARTGTIRALSAGCSYGAEAYTLAAVVRTVAPNVRVAVTGIDIDRRMVERARVGRFSADDARSAPDGPLRRWFELDGDDWVARAELRTLLTFEVGDLLRARFARNAYDLVLCRNTVIYFTDDVRDDLHARLAAALRPGGYLLIGSTERVSAPAACGLVPAFPFTYRKAD